MSITKNVLLKWYFWMNFFVSKDSDNFWQRKWTLKVKILPFLTTFTQLTTRLKNFLMDWLLVLGLEEGLVECATLCIKSWVILRIHEWVWGNCHLILRMQFLCNHAKNNIFLKIGPVFNWKFAYRFYFAWIAYRSAGMERQVRKNSIEQG